MSVTPSCRQFLTTHCEAFSRTVPFGSFGAPVVQLAARQSVKACDHAPLVESHGGVVYGGGTLPCWSRGSVGCVVSGRS